MYPVRGSCNISHLHSRGLLRISSITHSFSQVPRAAIYRITFDTATYYTSIGGESFYPEVSIVFDLKAPQEHYHVPLLLSPFGYSTYRGS